VALSDATGNRWKPQNQIFDRQGDEVALKINGGLSPSERAWKFEVELARTAAANFTPAELWRVGGVAAPAAGQFVLTPETTVRDGVKYQFVGLSRELAIIPDALQIAPTPYYVIRATPKLPLGMEITLVEARGSHGESVRVESSSTAESADATEVCARLKPLPADGRIDFTFAIQRTRSVEFLAKPKRAGVKP